MEEVERHKDAQLAYSFDIALQNEFSLEENIALARQFLLEQFVSRGMVVDFAVHRPDKEDGGIPNPHFHVLCPIRAYPGGWQVGLQAAARLPAGRGRQTAFWTRRASPSLTRFPTTDWGRPGNAGNTGGKPGPRCATPSFAEKGLPCRIDHRSYLRQGLDLLPTVHEGPAVRQMEAKGISTDKGDLNRWIKATNALLKDLKQKNQGPVRLAQGGAGELSKPRAPTLADLLGAYYGARNAGAWSNKGKVGNLQKFGRHRELPDRAEALHRGQSGGPRHFPQRADRGTKGQHGHQAGPHEGTGTACWKQAERYRELKPIHTQLNAIHRKGQREKFKAAHEGELRQFYMARRKLEPHFTPEGKLPLSKWRAERGKLQQAYQEDYAKYKPIRDDLMKLYQVKSTVDTARRQQEQAHTQRRDRDMER